MYDVITDVSSDTTETGDDADEDTTNTGAAQLESLDHDCLPPLVHRLRQCPHPDGSHVMCDSVRGLSHNCY